MKFVFKQIIALLVFTPSLLIAQDASRLGATFGYDQSIQNIALDEFPTSHNAVILGLGRSVRFTSVMLFEYGVDFMFVNFKFNERPSGLINPPQIVYDENVVVGSIYFKTRNYTRNEKLFYGIGLLVDYDFNPIDDIRYHSMSGLGAQIQIGYDYHLSDKYVITFSPHFSKRAFVAFRKEKMGLLEEYFGRSSVGINVSLQYKVF